MTIHKNLVPNDAKDEEPQDQEKVGHCNPPKHSQFKKGNKFGKGRPPGSKNLKTLFNEAFGQKVQVKLAGKTKKMTKLEIAMHKLASKSSEGDLKAISKAIELYETYGPQDSPAGPEPEKINRDLEAMRAYLKMQDQMYPPSEDIEGDE